ncbi:MAG TPA: hydrogen gas-evolving membrane-bound hydrogenase subunit E [Solirubrobacteraceae bacterium]|nr:hydrogen gas-evolving membrane-bound hydrogenase subunit E [Solirubrobacteraceae bacterium]
MSRTRLGVAAVGLILVAGGFAWGASGLPAFGHYHFRYGAIVSRDAVPDRAATNSVVVTAFDYRAFDTLGEEFILFVSVAGVTVLLRRMREEHDEDEPDRSLEQERAGSAAERWLGGVLVAPLTLLSVYIIVHGQLTPGGGFQGGVILMSALAFAVLGGEYSLLRWWRGGASWIEVAEAAGAAGFAMLGFGGLIATGAFFANFVAKGKSGLLTGGFIPIANIAVGLEVASALLIVISELLYQRLLAAPS